MTAQPFDATEILAGAAHNDGRGDLAWALQAPHGNEVTRGLGLLLRKALRRCAGAVTFDRGSFERAVGTLPAGALPVLAPSHRSYFDFLLASYLCFQHPEFGLAVPHIAAAEEFGRMPMVGRVLKRAQAFFLRRGGGRTAALDEELRRATAKGGSLMFFVEGQRSRSRHTLAPKRGLLRGLQATGRAFAVLPIAIAYERIPEERSFERELTGGRRSRMYVGALVRWLERLLRGEEQMGRIHIVCGDPLALTASTDIGALARAIVAEQQRHTAITRMHLRAFIEEVPSLGIEEDWLAAAIERRGGCVLDAGLPPPRGSSAVLRQCLRNQWMHWFFGDARALLPESHAVHDHIERRGWFEVDYVGDRADPRLGRLVEALFSPVITDYELARRSLGTPGGALAFSGPVPLVRAYPSAHLPHLEDAFLYMQEHGLVMSSASGEPPRPRR